MTASHRVALSALASAVILASLTFGTVADPQAQKPAAAKPAKAATAKVKTDTRIYLLRGLLNVFSLGMDTLQERLSLMGFQAEVDNHNGWITIANKIVEDRNRGHNGAVVLIGHSLGADVLFQLTERLEKENVPVRLAVFFDPTISHDISRNVEHVLNLYQLNGFGRKVTAPKGYKGELVNMDLSGDASISHGSIDKSEKLHDLVIAKIMKVAVGPAQRKRSSPAKQTPVAATPPGSAATMPASSPADASAPAKPSATPPAQVPRI
jgi:thioesterase domain-containing protein